MQKKLIFISGTIGSGKTTLSKKIINTIPNSIMLDGDWCFQQGCDWHFDETTKQMAIKNIIYVLNNFLENPNFETVIFCWTLHRQAMMNQIYNSLNMNNVSFYHFRLLCSDEVLKERITKRFFDRRSELGIEYNEKDIENMLLGSIKKKSLYVEDGSIVLDGDANLEQLSEEIIETISQSDKIKVKTVDRNQKKV